MKKIYLKIKKWFCEVFINKCDYKNCPCNWGGSKKKPAKKKYYYASKRKNKQKKN